MTKFYVTLNIDVEADNVDEARTLAYDIMYYGEGEALCKSETAKILNYSVEVDEE